MKLKQTITSNGEIHFTDHQRAYLKKNVGKQVFITIDQRSTVEKQQFIEGAIVPYFFYQHEIGVFKDFSNARYSLKKIANHTEFQINEKGEQEESVKSMSDIYESNTKTAEFIDKIQDYFLSNGYLFPESSHHKEWRDTNVDKGANEYPPLQELVRKYKSTKEDNIPNWHRK